MCLFRNTIPHVLMLIKGSAWYIGYGEKNVDEEDEEGGWDDLLEVTRGFHGNFTVVRGWHTY